MTILNNGNIGMGNTEPNESLVIQNTDDTWIKLVNGSADKFCGIKFVNNYSSTEYGGDNYIDWVIHTGHNIASGVNEVLVFGKKSTHGTYDKDNVLVLNTNGYVGIGTSYT